MRKKCSIALASLIREQREPPDSHLLFCWAVYELFSCLVKYMLKCLSESIGFCVDHFNKEIIVIVIIKYFLHCCEKYVFFAEKVYDCTS